MYVHVCLLPKPWVVLKNSKILLSQALHNEGQHSSPQHWGRRVSAYSALALEACTCHDWNPIHRSQGRHRITCNVCILEGRLKFVDALFSKKEFSRNSLHASHSLYKPNLYYFIDTPPPIKLYSNRSIFSKSANIKINVAATLPSILKSIY